MMNETTVLLVIMGLLAAIEAFLILSVWKLIKTLEKINEKVKKFEEKVDDMVGNIKGVYQTIMPLSKLLGSGELNIHGKSASFGEVNFKISMDKNSQEEKKEDSKLGKTLREEIKALEKSL